MKVTLSAAAEVEALENRDRHGPQVSPTVIGERTTPVPVIRDGIQPATRRVWKHSISISITSPMGSDAAVQVMHSEMGGQYLHVPVLNIGHTSK